MERYGPILSVQFGATALGLPMAARICRQASADPAGGEAQAFPSSVQVSRPGVRVEVTVRDVAAAEGLALGAAAALTLRAGPTRAAQAPRELTIDRAVLLAVETHYEQSAPARATLVFQGESVDGSAEPFAAREVTP